MKKIKIKITQKMCDELNTLDKELKFDTLSNYRKHEPCELECLYG